MIYLLTHEVGCCVPGAAHGGAPAPAPTADGNFASISCEKWEVGAIIGHHGKAIKELERLSGASIHVDRTTHKPAVRISGSVVAVAKARRYTSSRCIARCEHLRACLIYWLLYGCGHRLVESKLAEAKEGPDYEGKQGKRLRAEAEKHGDEMHRLFEEAHAAHEHGK